MTYKCINSFICGFYGKHYTVGSIIGETEYNNLSDEEKQNFKSKKK